MKPDELRRTERRFSKVWTSDGLPETFLGLFALAGGLVLFAAARGWWGMVLLFLFAPLGTRLLGRVMWAVKTRVSDPRLGYVRPRRARPSGRRFVATVISAGLLFAVLPTVAGWVERTMPAVDAWWPTLLTLPVAASFLVGWRLAKLHRFFWVGLVALLAAVAGPAVGLLGSESLALFYVILGVLLLASGLVTLRRFLRATPRVEAS